MQRNSINDTHKDCKVLPSREKKGVKGKIHIISDRCKECNLCINFCPRGVLRQSDKINQKGYHLPKLEEDPANNKICVACGYCEVICPDYAIWVEESKD